MSVNTKRILSLILSLCMIFSVTAFAFAEGPEDEPGGGGGGSAASPADVVLVDDFLDSASIKNREAVGFLVKLGAIGGVLSGSDGYNFLPDRVLMRSELASLVADSLTLISGDAMDGKTAFTDVTSGHWAEGKIAYCASNGIINGATATTFNPDGTATGTMLAKLLLASMGVRGLTGSYWEYSTYYIGSELGLFTGMTDTFAALKAGITRDDAAQMIYNALVIVNDGNAALPMVNLVKATTSNGTVVIEEGQLYEAPAGKLLTLTSNKVEMAIEPGVYPNAVLSVTDYYGQIGSFGGGAANHYEYRAGLYVDETGIVNSRSATDAVNGGTYNKTGASNIKMDSTSHNFNGIIVNGDVDYTISNSTFKFLSGSDGSNVNDFSGYGAVISAFNGARVTLDNVDIETEGVAKLSSFTDEYAHTIFKDSTIKVMGGKLYDGYLNTADQSKMVAPPWVLGITGNARGTNLEGNLSSTTVYDSDMYANQWGVVSTDAGKNMLLMIIDSKLELLGEDQEDDPFSTNYGSGYGTYAIGNAYEYFYGAEINVGTYATIITGGHLFFDESVAGQEYKVYEQDTVGTGIFDEDMFGVSERMKLVDSDRVVFDGLIGKGNKSVINSDAFGFMAHGMGSVTLSGETIVNTNNATFLFKVGNLDVNVTDGTELNTADGVILQMMDNDDSLVGVDMGVPGYNGPVFLNEYKEAAGWHSGDPDGNSKDGGAPVNFTATDVTLEGDFYNGSGNYYVEGMGGGGAYTGNALNITLGTGVTLKGAIASTEVMHVDENGKQNTYFTINEYYYLGHMANQPNFNGANVINVELKDGAVWTVDGECLLQSLKIGAGCSVVVPAGYTITVDGEVVTALTVGSYDNVVITVAK